MTEAQELILMERFLAIAYPNEEEISQLSLSFNVTKKAIKCWLSDMVQNKAAGVSLSQSE